MIYDVAIIGAGFGGSLMALILQRLGLRTVLIDRARHPRFAIGESATPIGDLIWAKLTEQYHLPRLRPLAEYGTWQRAYPELPCGLKRGFSYVVHRPGERFVPAAEHRDEMLVAASYGQEDADTHWYRAEFDAFVCREAQAAGVDYFDETQLTELHSGDLWHMRGNRLNSEIEFRANFLIDAAGEQGFLARHLGLQNRVTEMQTNSRPLFAHFRDVPQWSDLHGFIPGSTGQHPFADHPYPCDDAVLHHQFAGGWMWVIPFNNGITSAGFALDQRQFPPDERVSPEAEWQTLLQRYPSIGDQLRSATVCGPGTNLIRGGRMQRWLSPAAGRNWALLPTAALFLDPLHSTGNAHTLSGIERLSAAFAQHLGQWDHPQFQTALSNYDRTLQAEARHLDRIIHGCYLTLDDMDLFEATSALYFVAAIWAEQRRRSGLWQPQEAFLGALDPDWSQIVETSYRELVAFKQSGVTTASVKQAFIDRIRDRIAPYNLAGLCDPARNHLYPYPPPELV